MFTVDVKQQYNNNITKVTMELQTGVFSTLIECYLGDITLDISMTWLVVLGVTAL